MWGEEENNRLLARIMQPDVPNHTLFPSVTWRWRSRGEYSAAVVAPDPTAANAVGSIAPMYNIPAPFKRSHIYGTCLIKYTCTQKLDSYEMKYTRT